MTTTNSAIRTNPRYPRFVTADFVVEYLAKRVPLAPNETIAWNVDSEGVAYGKPHLFVGLDVWSLPAGSWVLARRSVTGSVTVRTIESGAREVQRP